MRESYAHREAGWIFCHIEEPKVVASNSLAVAIRDGFLVTPHHTLLLPRRHVVGWFDLYRPERVAIERLLDEQRGALQAADPSIAGFNIGVNAGEAAAQTIFHCRIHLIPRRSADVEKRRGGVRHYSGRRIVLMRQRANSSEALDTPAVRHPIGGLKAEEPNTPDDLTW